MVLLPQDTDHGTDRTQTKHFTYVNTMVTNLNSIKTQSPILFDVFNKTGDSCPNCQYGDLPGETGLDDDTCPECGTVVADDDN